MKWSQRVANFLAAEDGPTAVEYAVLLFLIAGMMIASIIYVGNETQILSGNVVDGLQDALND